MNRKPSLFVPVVCSSSRCWCRRSLLEIECEDDGNEDTSPSFFFVLVFFETTTEGDEDENHHQKSIYRRKETGESKKKAQKQRSFLFFSFVDLNRIEFKERKECTKMRERKEK